MTGIVVETKRRVTFDRFESTLCRRNVKRDFSRVYFQGELHTLSLESIEDGPPPLCEVLVAQLDRIRRSRRERVKQVPYRASSKSIDDINSQLLRGLGGIDYLLGRTLPDSLGLAVTPHIRRQDSLMTCVNIVAHSLANQVRRDCEHLKAMLFQQGSLGLAVTAVAQGLVHIEVVAPAR